MTWRGERCSKRRRASTRARRHSMRSRTRARASTRCPQAITRQSSAAACVPPAASAGMRVRDHELRCRCCAYRAWRVAGLISPQLPGADGWRRRGGRRRGEGRSVHVWSVPDSTICVGPYPQLERGRVCRGKEELTWGWGGAAQAALAQPLLRERVQAWAQASRGWVRAREEKGGAGIEEAREEESEGAREEGATRERDGSSNQQFVLWEDVAAGDLIPPFSRLTCVIRGPEWTKMLSVWSKLPEHSS
eukprot:3842568-Rhodomonas_salina.2